MLWLWWVMIFHKNSHWVNNRHGLHRNKHTHTALNPNTEAHATPLNCRGETSLPCKTTQQHTWGLLTCSVDSSIFHWWERRHRTQGGERNESETTQQAWKKSTCLFFARRQMNVGVNRFMQQKKNRRQCDGREGEKKCKWRQVEWHKTNCVTELSNGCEIH